LAELEDSSQDDEDQKLSPSGAACRRQDGRDNRVGYALFGYFREPDGGLRSPGTNDRTTIASNPT
jgi:hypothetical protein